MGMLSNLKNTFNEAVESANQKAEEKRKAEEELKNSLDKIKVSTSSVCRKFEVIDAVWAFDFSEQKGWIFKDPANMGEAVAKVVSRLRTTCLDFGGDAVINCNFSYHYVHGDNQIKRVEVHAYGTAVRFID